MSLDAAQEVTVETAATPQECFAAVVDFEHYPTWSSAVVEARIIERDPAGIGRLVEFVLDAKIKRLRYVLEYAYRKPSELTWRSVDGDVQSIEGVYRFRKRSPTGTEVTCRQEIQLGFWLPGPLRRLAERTALKQSVDEFKAEVERRLSAGGKTKPTPRRGRA